MDVDSQSRLIPILKDERLGWPRQQSWNNLPKVGYANSKHQPDDQFIITVCHKIFIITVFKLKKTVHIILIKIVEDASKTGYSDVITDLTEGTKVMNIYIFLQCENRDQFRNIIYLHTRHKIINLASIWLTIYITAFISSFLNVVSHFDSIEYFN